MDGENNKQGFLPISGLLIALAALGVFSFSQLPYQGPRPKVPEINEPLEKINARLWQDPFNAVLDYQARPADMRVANAAGLICLNDQPNSCPKTENSLAAQLERRSKEGSVTVLGVMVFGSPYVAEVEYRLRQRYAVLSGLGMSGFVPDDPEHIGFVHLDSEQVTRSHILPFEWFTLPDKQDSVLLLWLNDAVFNQAPLAKLGRLVDGLRPQVGEFGENIHFKIVGPAGSGRLREMLEEIGSFDDRLSGLEIYSASATVDDSQLFENLGEKKRSDDDARAELERRFKAHGISLKRTIATDRGLAKALIDELSLRGVDLDSPENGNYMMLVGEWDTLYGRSLPLIYERVLSEGDCRQGKRKEEGNHVLRISYMRGIDGSIPGEREDKGNNKSEEASGQNGDVKPLEQAVGKSQYDYLRRLAEDTYRFNQELLSSGKGSIKAIGVLGSDFYDKYLVLQALRQRLPDVLFFTTDLDARLLHPDNFRWTRNLIVASSFGLQLPREVQGGVPPFRYNYQTAAFSATLQAFGKEVRNEEWRPKVFEIGRYQALELIPANIAGEDTGRKFTGAIGASLRGFGTSEVLQSLGKFMLIAVLLFALLFFSSVTVYTTSQEALHNVATCPKYKYLSLALAAVSLLLVIWALNIIGRPGEEPFSLFEGLSTWPTEILRLLTVGLSLFFLLQSAANLDKNSNDIGNLFEFSHLPLLPAKQRRNFFNYGWDVDGRNTGYGMDALWAVYLRRETWRYRILRMLPIILLYICLCAMIIRIFGQPSSPVRGPMSSSFDMAALVLSVLSFVFLNFYVFDVTRNCRRFIELSGKPAGWGEHSIRSFLQKEEIQAGDGLQEWMRIHLIAKRTDAVGKLIFYPFVIWLLLFVARFDYFDNWHLPIGLGIVLALGALYVWSSALVLRRSAEKARAGAIERLSRRKAGILAGKDPDQGLVKQIEFELGEVKAIRQGAFAPFTQHAVLQSLLIPFGGVGGVYLIDFLSKLNI